MDIRIVTAATELQDVRGTTADLIVILGPVSDDVKQSAQEAVVTSNGKVIHAPEASPTETVVVSGDKFCLTYTP